MNEATKPTEVNMKLEEIIPQRIDVTKYIGKRERIAETKVMQGSKGYYLQVITRVVGKEKKGDKEIEIKASRIFNLAIDSEGKVGWAKDGEFAEFLKIKKARNEAELVGKEVIIQLTKDEKFLTFI